MKFSALLSDKALVLTGDVEALRVLRKALYQAITTGETVKAEDDGKSIVIEVIA